MNQPPQYGATPSGPRIAVLGGGIGGLAAAAFLHRAGLHATVFEQAPALGEVGAGLVVSPNAVRLIRRLGQLDSLLENAVSLEVGWEFRRWENGEVLSAEQLAGRCEELYGERTYVTHRADLLAALAAAVPPEWLRLGKRCIEVTQHPGGTELLLDDGTAFSADIVIGADGVHSVVRGTIAEASRPVFSGMCAYRANSGATSAGTIAR
jgi:salicylate hydroxylase